MRFPKLQLNQDDTRYTFAWRKKERRNKDDQQYSRRPSGLGLRGVGWSAYLASFYIKIIRLESVDT